MSQVTTNINKMFVKCISHIFGFNILLDRVFNKHYFIRFRISVHALIYAFPSFLQISFVTLNIFRKMTFYCILDEFVIIVPGEGSMC